MILCITIANCVVVVLYFATLIMAFQYILSRFDFKVSLLQKYLMEEKKSNAFGGEGFAGKVSFDYKHFLETIFSSTGGPGAKKKGRNVAEVEGADEQYAEACEQKKEMDHQVGNA